jgi:hypothetical protein
MLPVQKVGVGTVKARVSQPAYVQRGLDCSPSSDVDTILVATGTEGDIERAFRQILRRTSPNLITALRYVASLANGGHLMELGHLPTISLGHNVSNNLARFAGLYWRHHIFN